MRPSFPPRALVGASVLAAALVFAPALIAQQPKAPESIVLTGAPLGAVTFMHKLHAQDRKVDCKTCHHASKPEKPLKTEFQKCTDCHAKTVAAPMKTPTRGAFHDPMAKKGTCIDCHVAENAKGKKAPAKCPDCHKKGKG